MHPFSIHVLLMIRNTKEEIEYSAVVTAGAKNVNNVQFICWPFKLSVLL